MQSLLAALNMPRCRYCLRTIWWWQLASHRKAAAPMHFSPCFLAWDLERTARVVRRDLRRPTPP